MTASTVWINGERLGEYKGGYTPFSFELTPHLDFDGENLLAVDVDSTERPDIPPFGYEIDYLTFGGIYREVSLRVVPATFIENIFVRPKDVLTREPCSRCRLFRPTCWRPRKKRFDDRSRIARWRSCCAKGFPELPAAGAASEPVAHTAHLEGI